VYCAGGGDEVPVAPVPFEPVGYGVAVVTAAEVAPAVEAADTATEDADADADADAETDADAEVVADPAPDVAPALPFPAGTANGAPPSSGYTVPLKLHDASPLAADDW